jgi:class III poly(R)-hydroxyalkanoic acid synthase PhaE subunit
MNSWVETTKQVQQTFSNLLGVKSGSGEASGQGFFNLYNSWLASMAGPPGRAEHFEAVSETASKLFGSSNVYMRLYEVWLPLVKAMQEKTFDPNSYRDLFEPSTYKEVLDKAFGFSPEGVQEFYDQAAKLMQAWTSTGDRLAPWSQAMDRGMKALPQFLEGRPESILGVFHDLFSAFDTTFGKAFHIPAVGKDREKAELLLRLTDAITVYLAKNTKYQYLMYVTGLNAMDKVVEAAAAKIKDGVEIKGFDEFFDLWLQMTEKRYLELFETDEFSKLQGEFFDAALDVRRNLFKLEELYLYDTPIPLRSEMDDLYKVVYDLKKKLRGLERQVKELKGKEVTA